MPVYFIETRHLKEPDGTKSANYCCLTEIYNAADLIHSVTSMD